MPTPIRVAVGVYGTDTIKFNISGAGVHTITPATTLPAITSPVTIDGYTQPGSAENTLENGDNAVLLIQLTGSPSVNGLVVEGGSSTIRGLVINGFGGVSLQRCGDHIALEQQRGRRLLHRGGPDGHDRASKCLFRRRFRRHRLR